MSDIITLITDFGTRDEYAGVMKGVILSINPQARIIDISHHIEPGNIKEAALMIRASYEYFPKGSVHLIVVDPGVGTERGVIAATGGGHIFVCPDNGILTLLIKDKIIRTAVKCVKKEYFADKISNTFHGRDVFAPVCARLSSGINPCDLGTCVNPRELVKIHIPAPVISVKEKKAEGEIAEIDRFGNLITNIRIDLIKKFCHKNSLIEISAGKNIIKGISPSYASVPSGAFLAIFGSRGYLEISVNSASAAEFSGMKKGDKIILRCVQKQKGEQK